MGLLSISIANDQRNTVSDDQGPWRQFILDHLDYIARRSKNYQIEDTLMNLYRYDLKRFLKDYQKRQEDIAWITLLLNDMYNDLEFVNPGIYMIPADQLILDLYHSFVTTVHNDR